MVDWVSLSTWDQERPHFTGAHQSVVRIERQPSYHDGPWLDLADRWGAGEPINSLGLDDLLADWLDLISSLTSRGVTVERVRITSAQPTLCQRWQRAAEAWNVIAGEQFWYLDEREANQIDLDLGEGLGDWWLFDDRLLLALHFDLDGRWTHSTATTDTSVVRSAVAAWRSAKSISRPAPSWEVSGA